jgi:hypothetical protein
MGRSREVDALLVELASLAYRREKPRTITNYDYEYEHDTSNE